MYFRDEHATLAAQYNLQPKGSSPEKVHGTKDEQEGRNFAARCHVVRYSFPTKQNY